MAEPSKKRKPRSSRSCYFCRFSRQSCKGHPYLNPEAEKCTACSANDLPCGPYETAQETRDFFKSVAYLHTINGQDSQRSAASSNLDDRQPTASEPQSQNARSQIASFVPQNSTPDTGLHDNQLPTTPHTSQEAVDSSVSGIGPTSATFTGISDLPEDSFDFLESLTDSYADLEHVDPTYDQAQSSHIEDESAVLSILVEHDLLGMAHDQVASEIRVLHNQGLECERAVRHPIQRANETIENDLQRVFEQMLNAFDDAQRGGKIDQARGICERIEGALEKTHSYRSQSLPEAGRKDALLKIQEFHTKYKDVSGADRISYELLQSDTASESRALNFFADSIKKSLERVSSETERMGDTIPPLHRLAVLGNAALFPILQKVAASGSVPRRGFIGQTILHVAVTMGHTQLLEYLLNLRQSYTNFPSIEDRDWVGRTALYLAISHGQTAAYHLLIDRGASLDVRDLDGHSPLMMACRGNHGIIIEDLILNRKRPVNERPLQMMGGCQPLHAAAERGCLDAVQILLENGADPTATKLPGQKTAADLARDNGHPDVAACIETGIYHQGSQAIPGITLPFDQAYFR